MRGDALLIPVVGHVDDPDIAIAVPSHTHRHLSIVRTEGEIRVQSWFAHRTDAVSLPVHPRQQRFVLHRVAIREQIAVGH